MVRIAAARDDDRQAIERYLTSRPDTTMFLRSNLRHGGLGWSGARYEGQYMLAWDGDAVVGIVGHAWNGMVLVQAESPASAGELATAAIARSGRRVVGFTGPHEQVAAARAALALDGEPTRLDVAETLLSLSLDALVIPAPLADGRVRVRHATTADRDPLLAWRTAYGIEANGASPGPDNDADAERWFTNAIAEHNAWLAECDGAPVAMTSFNARLPDAVQVGGVYTPPAMRARGFARAVVAASLCDARAEGVIRAVLFTASADALAAYRAVGFEIVGQYGIVLFA